MARESLDNLQAGGILLLVAAKSVRNAGSPLRGAGESALREAKNGLCPFALCRS